MQRTVALTYTVLSRLPENWQNPESWPGPGCYVIEDSLEVDMYFVTPYAVSVSFDAMLVIDMQSEISDAKMTPETHRLANEAIRRAIQSSLKDH